MKVSERGALTNCRVERVGQVRAAKESQQARGTHILMRTEGATSQGSERKPVGEGHSRSVERKGGDSSGQ